MRSFPTLATPTRIARRAALTATLVAVAAIAGVAHAQTAAPASAPAATQQRAQVPGYYRMALGDAVVTALYDGYVDLEPKTLLGLSAQSVQSLLARMFVSSTPGMQTAVNGYLIEAGGLDIAAAPVIGIAAESMCRFLKPLAYPEPLEAGLRVGHLGTSSVRYEIGIFRLNEAKAAAFGHFVHVFVERAGGTPVPLPADIRAALERIAVGA